MAQISYSSLLSGSSTAFDPTQDTLYIDDPLLFATLLIPSLSADGRGITFEQQDMTNRSTVKTITLVFTGGFEGTNIYKTSTSWLVFQNGSQLLLGDNTTGTTADDSGSYALTGTGSNDLMLSFGADSTLNGGLGDDVLVTMGAAGGISGGSGSDAFNGGDGNDTLALENVAGLTGYTVNLLAGTGSVAAAVGSTFTVSNIENVDGSDAADAITGDANGNRLYGWDGADNLDGGDGNDTLNGGSGNDTLVGGNGTDTADYGSDPDSNADGFGVAVSIGSTQTGTWQGVAYNLTVASNGAATDGWGNTDDLGTVGTLENVIGSMYNDVIFGNNGANSLSGGRGTDLLVGGAGNDTLDGGTVGDANDSDWVSYRGATGDGVNVNLGTTSATPRTTSNIGTDTLLNIDGVIGSDFADSLVGGSNSTDFRGIKTEWFQGGIGADSLDGGWTDTGTAGMDAGDLEHNWARYDAVAGAITVNLSTGTAASDGEGGSDTLTDINAVWGGTAGDSLAGGNTDFDYRELFNGGAGSDTIDGGSGNDIALYRNSTSGISIALASGSGGGSDGLGGTDSLTNIEVVVGSDHNDTVTGGAGNQVFQGRKGDDGLDGGADNDTVDYYGDYDNNGDGFGVAVNLSSTLTSGNWRGFAFSVDANRAVDGWGNTDTLANFENITGSIYNDVLAGTDGINLIRGDRGDDLIGGRGGNDTIDGGSGNDMASYRFSPGAVTVNLATNTASDGYGNTDTLISIEQVRGSDHNDTLLGDPNHVNTFLSSFSAQVFEGGAGNDTIDGGGSGPGLVAVASYSSATGPVTVNLAQGWASDGLGGQDTLRNIGFVTGSALNDSLVGGGRSAQIVSSNLFESFEGGAGNDTIDGGMGTDRVVYSGGAVNVDLGAGTAQDGFGTTDTLIGIEQVRGSHFSDILTGSSGNNAFEGRGGNDTINGAGGADTLRFDQSPSAIALQFTGVGSGMAWDGYGTVDTFSNIQSVRGSDHNDTMLGGSGNETFEGMAGNDSIDGSTGTDTISYGSSLSGVGITLVGGSGSVSDHWGGTDSLNGIENITGSQFNDNIIGDVGNNLLFGQGGNDTFTGGLGNDTITGGFGFDVAHFSGLIGSYTITPTGGGNYTVVGADGSDSVSGVEQFIFGLGGPQTNAITYLWSQLPDGASFYFNPSLDVLNVDGGVSATDIDFSPIEAGPDAGRGAQFTQWNEATGQVIKEISLLFTEVSDPFNPFKVSSSHITFANGSVLKLGDDLVAAGDDDTTATLDGGAGNDMLISIGGSQTLNGLGGDDFLVTVTRQSSAGSSGTDVFNGGDDNDWLGLDGGQGGTSTQYTVSLAAGTGSIATTGNLHNSTFTVSGIENVDGSDVADHITGDTGNNQLQGWTGNDTLLGGAGNDSITGGQGSDSIDGGLGRDLLDYSQDGNGNAVTLDLGTGTATQGADTDTIAGIEHVIGTWSGDTLTANETLLLNYTLADNPFTLEGLGGNDTINGGSAAPSSYVTASYANSRGSVNVNLGANTATDGMGSTDTLTNIDAVIGSTFNDTLTGGSDSSQILSINLFEQFEGGLGNDTIDGGSGGDRVNYQNNLGAVTVTLDSDQDGGTGFNGTALEDNGILGSSTDTLINIEQVRGSNFADSLTGSSINNAIEGMGGNDAIDGGVGYDQARYSRSTGAINATFTSGGAGTVLDGLGGTDTLTGIEEIYGSDFADTLTGGSSNDNFLGMAGNDTISGGAAGTAGGYDRASYVTGPVGVGVTVSMSGTLGAGTATDQYGNTDTLISIESIQGSHGNDTLTGNAANINPYLSSYQAETFEGMAGNDAINGGTDAPTHFAQVTYASGPTGVGVTVNLATGTATDAFGNTDTLANIDGVIGSSGNDSLTGGSTSSQIIATGYFESFEGGAGNDTIDGGMGTDRVAYNGGAITVTLGEGVAAGTALDGYGNTDTLYNIEHVRASMFGDALTGNSANNAFEGRGGADTIDGLGGFDTLRFDGSAAAATVTFSNDVAGSGTANDGGFTGVAAATDSFTNIEAVRGSDWNDTLTGGIGNETFEGMAGSDNINGGAGNDTVSYASSLSAVTVTLVGGTGSVTDHWGGTDTLNSIEHITGSQFGDTLTGDDGDNVIRGLGGNDSIIGGGATDSAAYNDVRASYTVTDLGGGVWTVADINTANGDEGTDTLTNIYQLVFSDQTQVIGGGPQTFYWSALTHGSTLAFNAATDVVVFDDASISAAERGFTWTGDLITFSVAGKANAALNKSVDFTVPGGGRALTDTNVTYANGSKLLVGDNTVNIGNGSSTFDDLGNTLTGTAGGDRMFGLGGNDTMNGGGGNDTFVLNKGPAAFGTDTVDGGTGLGDTIGVGNHASILNGSTVDFGTHTVTSVDGTASFSNVESAFGTNFADTFIATDASRVLTGLGASNGNFDFARFLEGFAGNDTFQGDTRHGYFELANYEGAPSAVTVNLATGTASDGYDSDTLAGGIQAYTDTLTNIDGVRGSAFDDTLLGGGTATTANGLRFEQLEGMAGNDTLNGNGGPSVRAEYLSSPGAVTVNLGTGLATNDGWGGTDTLIGIAGLRGSNFDDSLTGNAGNNYLEGRAGNDFLDGGAGFDLIFYSAATSAVNIDLAAGSSSLTGGQGTDTWGNIEGVRGGDFDDTLRGVDGVDNIIEGLAGADLIDGRTGIDQARYDRALGAVNVNLVTNIVLDGYDSDTVTGGIQSYSDTLNSIERVRGSRFDDTLLGNTGDNGFEGWAGNDVITGDAGNDTAEYDNSPGAVTVSLVAGTASDGWGGTDSLSGIENVRGSQFADTITGDGGNNTIIALAGADSLDGGTGIDTATYAGLRSAYTVTRVGAGYTVTDTNTADGDDGSDTLSGIERLQFSDQTMMLGMTVRDFNGDGKSDILFRADASGALLQYQMDGFAATAAAWMPVLQDPAWNVVGNDDYNGDGKSDILLGNATTGGLIEYQMNGATVVGAAWIASPGFGWVVQ